MPGKVRDKIAMLQNIAPRATRYGQLYKLKKETEQKFKRIVLWTLFVSDDNEFMVRDHVFEGKEHRTPKEWHEWLTQKVNENDGRQNPPLTIGRIEYIQKNAVLPGISTRTGLKQWAVDSVIGWRGDAKHKPRGSAVGRKRNKTKQARRKNG